MSENTADIRQLTPIERHQLEKTAANYRLTPATLYSRLDPSWIPKQFLLKASLTIAKAIVQGNQRITVSAPPRHGKSRLTTIATPVWVLDVLRKFHVILCTYGGDLSTDFGREVKDICGNNEDLLSFKLRKDVSRNAHWLTDAGGGMTSVGVGGPITGRGANALLIDDYIKEIEEAESASQREKDWRWLTAVALTRLEPNATVIITATRWHEDDIIGRIKRGLAGPGWIHIEFPAEYLPTKLVTDENGKETSVPDYEAQDELGRRYGDVLFEERYSKESLQTRRHFLGDKVYDALFQQDPHGTSTTTTSRDWINVEKRGLTNWYGYSFVRVWDFGGTKGGGDYTVGMLLAVHPVNGDIWILDVKRGQWGALKIEREVKDCAISDGTGTAIIIEQEPGSSGKNFVEYYKNILPSYEVLGSPAITSKEIRSRPVIAAAEKGRVNCLDREWTEDFLDEFDGFLGRAKHDDQVDCLAIGYNHTYQMPDGGVVFGREVIKTQKSMEILRESMAKAAEMGKINHEPLTLRESMAITADSGYVSGATWGRKGQGSNVVRFNKRS